MSPAPCEPRGVSVAARASSALLAPRSAQWAPALATCSPAAGRGDRRDRARRRARTLAADPANRRDIAGWLQALGGERLGYRVFLIALLAFSGAYGGCWCCALRALRDGDRISNHAGRSGSWPCCKLIVFAGPILISTDVFSYIAYARMGVVHGINPYTHGPIAIVGDPVFQYVGHDWKNVATAYGPLYTLISYPLAPARRGGRAVGDEARGAARQRRHARAHLALRAPARARTRCWRCSSVGANPLYVIYGLGGAHNDLIMLAADDGRGELHARRPGARRAARRWSRARW